MKTADWPADDLARYGTTEEAAATLRLNPAN
jgi:hypothetical protein